MLWWGGIGNSTEHTAYLRLKSGIPAPQSGSIELNGETVAEQIGAQIFIDGWAMVEPGQSRTGRLSGRAGRRASAMTANPCMPQSCSRRWRRRPLSSATCRS